MVSQHWDFRGSLFPRIYPPDWEGPLFRTPGKTLSETGGYTVRWHFVICEVLCTYGGPGTIERRVVVSFSQMIMKLPALRGFLRLEVPVRVCVRPFPQEGSVSPFGYRTHFHTQLSLLEPGEEKNRRISQSSFQEVSDKMHVKQRQSSTLCALKENCYFCLPHCGLLRLSNFLGIRDVTQQFDCLIMFIEFACPLWA